MNYQPLPSQIPIHSSPERILLISGGEGSGKSYVTAAEIVSRYGTWHLVYIVGPKYEAAHKEVDYIYEDLLQIGATRKDLYQRPSRGKLVLKTVDGATVETLSAEDGAKAITGTGESPDLLAMVEAGKQSYEIYLACRGRVARSRGTLILSGTIEESERWYPELIDRWRTTNPEGGKSFILPTWSNTRLYPGGRDDPEIKALEATYPADRFMERFGAVPCPPSGLVFKEFSYTEHVRESPYWRGDEGRQRIPVEVWIDPGYAGAYNVTAVQIDGPQVDVIDEVYVQFGVASDVIGECMRRPWWKQVKLGVMDIAGKAHVGMETGKATHDEYWKKEARIPIGMKRVLIDDGIQRTRTFLKSPFTGEPRIHFDPRCVKTAWEFSRGYQRHPETGKVIDKHNHAAKAIAYGLVYHFGLGETTVQALPPKPSRPYAYADRG